MDMDREVSKVLAELKSSHSMIQYGALITIRTTLIKSKEAVKQLVEGGLLQMLLKFLKDGKSLKISSKLHDIVLSILANLCIEEDVRGQVVSCDGLSAVAEVLMGSERESIHNRGVRTIANLAQHSANCDTIFQLKIPAFVAKKLSETEDDECTSTYLRFFRIVGHTSENVKKLVEESSAISAVATILKKTNKTSVVKALRVLNEMSCLRCCAAFSEQVLVANVLEELVVLAEETDKCAANFAFSIVLRLSDHDNLRPPLGNAGAIDLFMREMKNVRSQVNLVSVLNALCLFSREAVNRQKLFSADTLELYISSLDTTIERDSNKRNYSVLYDRIISSLVNFLYDDRWITRLLELNLVPVLLSHLIRVTSIEIPIEDLSREIGLLACCKEKRKAEMTIDTITNCPDNENEDGMDKCQMEITRIKEKQDNISSMSTLKMIVVDVDCQETVQDIDTIAIDSNELPQMNNSQSGSLLCQEDPDEEVTEIISNSEKLQSSSSKHVFSINSPTYQLEQSSWSMENYSSGVTCKTFNTPEHSGLPLPPVDSQDIPPFSPFSGSASYYSPAYSPCHSFGSSPKYSPNPHTSPSYSRGQGSSQSSPVWSLASSDRLSPVDGINRLNSSHPSWPGSSPLSSNPQASLSPLSTNTEAPLSPLFSSVQAPLSPLNISFPSSPPVQSFGEDHEPQSPFFNSQMSLINQSESQDQNLIVSGSSQENVLSINSALPSEREIPFVREVSRIDNNSHRERYEFSVVPLSQGEELIYSASEEDPDEEEEEVEEEREIPGSETRNSHQVAVFADQNPENPDTLDESVSHKSSSGTFADHKHHTADLKRSHSSPASSMDKDLDSDRKDGSLDYPMESPSKKRKLKEMSSTINCVEKSVGELSRSVDDLSEQNRKLSLKSGSEDLFESSQQGSRSTDKTVFKKLSPNRFYRGRQKQSTLNSVQWFSLSPYRSLSPGTSSSPLSIHGMSPLASLSPYRSPYQAFSPSHNNSEASKIEHSSDSVSLLVNESKPSNTDTSESPTVSSSRQNSHLQNHGGKTQDISSDSLASNGTNSQSNERIKGILRATESNILILLSRVSLKTNPSQYFIKPKIFNVLLGYLSLSPDPLQRCFRLLNRVCNNQLCFQPLMLIQGPALIIKHLILEQDGSIPSILFTLKSSENERLGIYLDELIPSSQNSDAASSQASEFSQWMEFEFGGDAYSRTMSRSFPSPSDVFRQHPSISHDSQSAQDGSSAHGGVVYENNSIRRMVQVQMAIHLLRALSSIALSRYGDGEVRHILSRGTSQDKLQCVISLLHLLIACGPFSRNQLLSKASFQEVIPLLFESDAPMARATIITAISLYAHLNGVSKVVGKMSEFKPCPDVISDLTEVTKSAELQNKVTNLHGGEENREKETAKGAEPIMLSKNMEEAESLESVCSDQSTSYQPHINGKRSCIYEELSSKFDLNLIVINENSEEAFRAHRDTIMKKSTYFSNMLGGAYAEAYKKEVVLKNLSFPGFQYVLHYLHGCVSGCPVIDSVPLKLKSQEGVDGSVKSLEGGTVDPKIVRVDSGVAESLNSDKNRKQTSGIDNSVSDCSRSSSIFEVTVDKHSLSKEKFQNTFSPSPSNSCDKSIPPEDVSNKSLSSASQTLTPSDSMNIDLDGQGTSPRPHSNTENCSISNEEKRFKQIDTILDNCEEIMSVADQFLLKELIDYITSVLSHVCLLPHTCEFIFCLACVYELNDLAFDSVAEIILSGISRSEVSEFFLKAGQEGYRQHAENALHCIIETPK